MRKRYRSKKSSCPLCKPHKMGWENRWRINDLRAEEDEKYELEFVPSMICSVPYDYLEYEKADYLEMMQTYE